jgi:hypothetical protein
MTAVEFLIDQICGEHTDAWKEEIKQALELEKQQIIDAHGLIAKLQEDGSHKLISGETYYDETYKNKTK